MNIGLFVATLLVGMLVGAIVLMTVINQKRLVAIAFRAIVAGSMAGLAAIAFTTHFKDYSMYMVVPVTLVFLGATLWTCYTIMEPMKWIEEET